MHRSNLQEHYLDDLRIKAGLECAGLSTTDYISFPTSYIMSNHSQPHIGQMPVGTSSPSPVLEFVFPGFSAFSSAVHAFTGIDLNVYIPVLILVSSLSLAWSYLTDFVWSHVIETHFMSIVKIRTDDEIYNIMMTWVANQKFAKSSRRFFANVDLKSRHWMLWDWDNDEDEDDEEVGSDGSTPTSKTLHYTPAFGTHFFWYKGCLLFFERLENRDQPSLRNTSDREELSISCFGRDPRIIKELLIDARTEWMKKDEHKTLIYRGTSASTGGDPTWQRSLSRSSRPFSTVILNEKVKQDLIDDVREYLHPATRRWYANRGIPFRRGYLLEGPPGTGKSSLSLAIAGFFKMRIYMVSLSSVTASEDSLSSLFANLPRRCVVLLEDIDTAGLTHTREENGAVVSGQSASADSPSKDQQQENNEVPIPGRLSLSGLLNILDGVASQEGRILIMTTNHVEKLDRALIRPGRVDMIIKFGLADAEISASIFRAIYAPYEDEDPVNYGPTYSVPEYATEEQSEKAAEQKAKDRASKEKHIQELSRKFAAKVPEQEFSPAELQGLLLRHKRNPEKAIECVDDWVTQTRKEKKQKEVEAAEDRRREEEKKKQKEEEQKKEEENERKEEKRKARKKKQKAKRKQSRDSSSDSDSDSDSGANTESDSEHHKKDNKTEGKKEKQPEIDGSEERSAKIVEKQSKGNGVDEDEALRDHGEAENEHGNEARADDVQERGKGTSDSGYDTPDRRE